MIYLLGVSLRQACRSLLVWEKGIFCVLKKTGGLLMGRVGRGAGAGGDEGGFGVGTRGHKVAVRSLSRSEQVKTLLASPSPISPMKAEITMSPISNIWYGGGAGLLLLWCCEGWLISLYKGLVI